MAKFNRAMVTKAVYKASRYEGTTMVNFEMVDQKNDALEALIPILVGIIGSMPWWKKWFIGLKTLLRVLNEYLNWVDTDA